MKRLMLLAAAVLLAGCAPDDIATARCTNTMLAIGDPWTCSVSGTIVGQPSSVTFSTESRNRVAEVEIALRVTKGTVRIRYYDLTGERHFLINPSQPAMIAMKTGMGTNRSFVIHFEPINGPAEGLSGTVKYSTP